jgi:hypothetical protein
MGIAATSEHVKAAFILSKNKMDITSEGLHAVKEIDAKITAIADRLHPLIAAHMIKEGLNPLEMHADQLLAYIKRFNFDMGESGAEKTARYIRELDKNRAIDSDTRKTMIAIYRMLHVIQKDGAASLGLAAQMNAPLTLGGLFNLSQNRRGINQDKSVDITVNDALGELERLTRPEGNIRAAIESGTTRQHISHMDIVADGFTDMAQPTVLAKLIQAAGGMEQALEDLANAEKEPVPTNYASMTDQIESIVAANPETIYMLQGRNISTRLGNVKAADELAKTDRALEDTLTDLGRDNEQAMEAIPASDLSALRGGQTVGQILAQIHAALGEDNLVPTWHKVHSLFAVTHGLNGDAEEGFQLPIRVNGRIRHLKMHVLNERALTADGARIFLSLDTARLGTVTAYFTVNNEGTHGLNAVIAAQTPAALATLESHQNDLMDLAQQVGVDINGIRFTMADGINPYG